MTFRYQPDHKMTIEAARRILEGRTKADLIAWCAEQATLIPPAAIRGNLAPLSKGELVDYAAEVARILIDKAQAAEAARIAAREATLAAEAADGLKARMLAAAHEGVAKIAAAEKAACENAAAEIAKDPIYRLAWDAGKMYKAHATYRELTAIAGYFATRAADQDKTLAEIDTDLKDWAARKLDDVTRPHLMNSTSLFGNAADLAQWEGKCQAARMFNRLVNQLWLARKEDAARYKCLGW